MNSCLLIVGFLNLIWRASLIVISKSFLSESIIEKLSHEKFNLHVSHDTNDWIQQMVKVKCHAFMLRLLLRLCSYSIIWTFSQNYILINWNGQFKQMYVLTREIWCPFKTLTREMLLCVFTIYLWIFWFKYDLRKKYYTPQIRPNWGSNSWPPDHDSILHVTEMPALTTRPSVTARHIPRWSCEYL